MACTEYNSGHRKADLDVLLPLRMSSQGQATKRGDKIDESEPIMDLVRLK